MRFVTLESDARRPNDTKSDHSYECRFMLDKIVDLLEPVSCIHKRVATKMTRQYVQEVVVHQFFHTLQLLWDASVIIFRHDRQIIILSRVRKVVTYSGTDPNHYKERSWRASTKNS